MTNKTPFVLFVLQSSDENDYISMISGECDATSIYSLKELEEYIYEYKISLIIIDMNLIRGSSDEQLLRWIIGRKMIPAITLVRTQNDVVKSISLKVIDYIYKPITETILRFQLRRILYYIKEMDIYTKINVTLNGRYNDKSKELADLQANVISVLSEIIEFRDFYKKPHDIRSREYIKLFMRKMIEIPNPYQREICLWDIEKHILASRLHDIGKIIISDKLLTKTAPLNEEERKKIQEHVTAGIDILDLIFDRIGENSYLEIARKYIESHHEQWDGKGYPYKLVGTDIPLEGRIMALIDAYDSLTSERSYRRAISHSEAMKRINYGSGAKYDPNLVKIFNNSSNEFSALKDSCT